MSAHSRVTIFRSFLWKFWLIFMAIFVSFACGIDLNRATPTANEADINQSVEATLNAEFVQNSHLTETAAALVVPDTPAPPQPTVPVIAPPTPTTGVPTVISTEKQPTATEAQASLSAIPINDWKTLYWVPLSSGCQNNEAKCFRLNDDLKALGGNPATAYLTSKEDILIDESWSSPYLVFWNKRTIQTQAMLSLIVDGTPTDVRPIPVGRNELWREEVLDLSIYKGKNIRVQISCLVGVFKKIVNNSPSGRKQNLWYVNDFRIVPDYKP